MQDVHIGPLPPTLNGISIYLYRLSKIDKSSQFIDWNKINKFKQFLIWLLKQSFNYPNKKQYIYHPPSLNQRLLLYFFSWTNLYKYSIVVHGNPLFIQYNNSRAITKSFIRKMLERAEYIHVVNPIYKILIKDYLKIENNNVIVKNAFLPPPLEEEKKIIKRYEKKLLDFIKSRNPILISNAAGLMFYKNQDLYGFDLCIQLINLLKSDFSNIGFIFALANKNMNEAYYKKMKNEIKNLKIQDNFYILTGRKRIWPLFKKADLMIRSTNRDGFSLSVAEALYFKCPVIASNVTKRPNNVILFENRNLEDLYNKSKLLLKKIKS